jgi:ubiquinone/menaquinone biosynthesis C-methylase UbiE
MERNVSSFHPTTRFSSRVGYYVRARPKYPPALLNFLQSDLGLSSSHRIADIGSGTGILSELLLRNGNPVIGVEPNDEMRTAGEDYLKNYPHFQSCRGTAEITGLPDHSADFIVAGQAFHWFDPPAARGEFQRILVPGGWVLLVWNERRPVTAGFDSAYDELVRRFAVDSHVDHHTAVTGVADSVLGPFFGAGHFRMREFDNFQELDRDDVRARLLSSSYMPLPDHPSFAEMMADADRAFASHEVGGRVRMSYDTRAYYGRMT